ELIPKRKETLPKADVVFAKDSADMRYIMRILGALFAALLLTSCSSSETFRYRLIVEVDTPQGPRTGSSVYEVSVWEMWGDSLVGNKVGGTFRGEAVAVDLPNGRTLYALTRNATWNAHYAISTPALGKGHFLGIKRARWIKDNHAKGELRRERFPMFVTFVDEEDPTSVMEVDRDDLEATFGAGYAVNRVRIEITKDPITTGLEKRLAWLPQFYDKQFSGDRYQDIANKEKGLSAYISAGAFSAGLGLKSRRNSE
ncbi:MAG: hypothetical protein AAFW59_06750, partial [Pseudomonadota bacterium]